MMYQQDPFASMMGQFGQMSGMEGMAGPGGFAGPQEGGFGGFGGGMFGAPQGKKKKGGFNPMMLSPLLSMFTSGHPNIGLGMISPGLGLARALGAFK